MSKLKTEDYSILRHTEGPPTRKLVEGDFVTYCDDVRARGLVVKVNKGTYTVDVLWSTEPQETDLYRKMARQIQVEIDRQIIIDMFGK